MQGITFQDVVKQYPNSDQAAIKGVNLIVPLGKLVVLLGPSGCGKTTLLKMVNRLYEPTSGSILLNDTEIREFEITSLRRQIGYVIQQVGLFPHMTVAENISLVPSLLKWTSSKTDARVDELLEMIHMNPETYRNRYPAQLSGGQQQRVGLARALAADPQVLLMDEPFGAIDAINRASLQQEVMQLQDRLKKTILFVTHDVDEALLLADKIAIIKGGQLVQYDTPWKILSEPANDFVRELMNADDRIRQLSVLKAADVMVPVEETPVSSDIELFDENTSLRIILLKFLSSDKSKIYIKNIKGQLTGVISFDQLRVKL
jgi:osmoprotectant transport system ATP-binding protein